MAERISPVIGVFLNRPVIARPALLNQGSTEKVFVQNRLSKVGPSAVHTIPNLGLLGKGEATMVLTGKDNTPLQRYAVLPGEKIDIQA